MVDYDNKIQQTIEIISSLYVCMAIKHIIVLFVETPRKFITANNVMRVKMLIIVDDPLPLPYLSDLAVINLRGVSTNKTIIIEIIFQKNVS